MPDNDRASRCAPVPHRGYFQSPRSDVGWSMVAIAESSFAAVGYPTEKATIKCRLSRWSWTIGFRLVRGRRARRGQQS